MVASFDAIVVGAGPAGAVAAYELARRGLHVAVLEKHQLPRYKTCGGVIARHVEKIVGWRRDGIRPARPDVASVEEQAAGRARA